MKKSLLCVIIMLALTLTLLSGCVFSGKNSADSNDNKSDKSDDEDIVDSSVNLSFGNVEITVLDSVSLVKAIEIAGKSCELDYTFDGNNISIENGTLTALVANTETLVTASAESFTATFTVKVTEKLTVENPEPENPEPENPEPENPEPENPEPENPEPEHPTPVISLGFNDITLDKGASVMLVKSIQIDGVDKEIEYSFDGDNVDISGYKLTALEYNTATEIIAKADGFEVSFIVTVAGDIGTMTVNAPKKIYTNYAPKPIEVTFSNPEFASDVTYTASDSRVAFENGGIYATGAFSSATDVTVTAKSAYHTKTFTVNVSQFSLNNDEAAVQYYEKNIIKPENKGGTIFIGDSYFSGQLKDGKPSFWSDFYEDYTDGKTFLMGISGSQIVNWEVVAERVVYPMEPKEIVLHIGFNDIHSSERSAYEIASRIIALLEEFREKLPDTKIYYCSVEPKKNALDAGSAFYERSMIYAPMINTMLEAYTYENKNVKFVNTRELFFNSNGTINKNLYLSSDLSHPTLEAYDLYKQAIEKVRGNAFEELTPSEVIDAVNANQSAVNSAAAESKLSSTVYTVDKTAGSGINDALRAKYFKDASGNALTNYYSISGYMELSDVDSNAHVQLRFSGTTADRFLIYDSDSDKKFGICSPFTGKGSEASAGAVADAIDATSGSAVIQWQILVTEKTAYLFINGVLALYGDPGALSYFNISSQGTNVSIWGVELVVKSENADAYNEILAEKKIV